MRNDEADLVATWSLDVTGAGAQGDVAGAGARLLAAWAEPHRRYHDLRHLTEVLDRVGELATYASDPVVVRLAAWFHDAVYDPRADDNEERSADLAREVLRGLAVDDETVGRVRRLVLLTARHEPVDGDLDGAVLCDADLAVLASGRYEQYAADVRAEYAHVSEEDFRRGRAAILRQLLDAPAVFRTPLARREWEAAARANVVTELARLGHRDRGWCADATPRRAGG